MNRKSIKHIIWTSEAIIICQFCSVRLNLMFLQPCFKSVFIFRNYLKSQCENRLLFLSQQKKTLYSFEAHEYENEILCLRLLMDVITLQDDLKMNKLRNSHKFHLASWLLIGKLCIFISCMCIKIFSTWFHIIKSWKQRREPNDNPVIMN